MVYTKVIHTEGVFLYVIGLHAGFPIWKQLDEIIPRTVNFESQRNFFESNYF